MYVGFMGKSKSERWREEQEKSVRRHADVEKLMIH
jgi:hypothetical protein